MSDTCAICGRDIFFCGHTGYWWHVECDRGDDHHNAEPEMKNNVKALAKFTSEELQAEVARRANESVKWGFVLIDDSDAEDGDDPIFGIVTIDEWEKTGSIGDYSLGNRVKLPDYFTESSESKYSFGGSVHDGTELLKKAGFKYLGVVDC